MTRTIDDLEAALHGSAPADVAIDDMLAAIRRRAPVRRRNRVVASVSATTLLAAAAAMTPVLIMGKGDPVAPAPAATFTGDCTIEALPLPASVAELYRQSDVMARAMDMDPTGRFALASFAVADGGVDRVAATLLWDNGVPTVLQLTAVDNAAAVNAYGVVVGTTMIGTDDDGDSALEPHRAFVYENGSLTVLPLPPGYLGASAYAVNERGEIAGVVTRNASGLMWDAAVWSAGPDRTPRVLESPGASVALGISDNGSVVGVATVSDSLTGREHERPYVWDPDGKGRFLDLPEGYAIGGAHQVRGEWALGSAAKVVSADPFGTVDSVVLWNTRTRAGSIVDGRGGGANRAVNAHGDVVMYDGVGSTLIRDGRRYELPNLHHNGMPTLSAFATAISDDATVILGEHSTDLWDGPTPIVLWRC